MGWVEHRGRSSATMRHAGPQPVGAVPIPHAPWAPLVSAPHLAVTAEGLQQPQPPAPPQSRDFN